MLAAVMYTSLVPAGVHTYLLLRHSSPVVVVPVVPSVVVPVVLLRKFNLRPSSVVVVVSSSVVVVVASSVVVVTVVVAGASLHAQLLVEPKTYFAGKSHAIDIPSLCVTSRLLTFTPASMTPCPRIRPLRFHTAWLCSSTARLLKQSLAR